MHHSAENMASKKKEGEELNSLVHCAFFQLCSLFLTSNEQLHCRFQYSDEDFIVCLEFWGG